VPAALRDRLGNEPTAALLELLDRAIDERKPEMITAATERFERRMVEEISTVRVLLAEREARLREELAEHEVRLREDLAEREGRLRQDLSKVEAGLREDLGLVRVDMATQGGCLRQEIAATAGLIRQEMAKCEGRIRQDIANGRVELFKWSFVFWIGQTVALAGLLAVMIRMVRP
jgi:hypothetical protein